MAYNYSTRGFSISKDRRCRVHESSIDPSILWENSNDNLPIIDLDTTHKGPFGVYIGQSILVMIMQTSLLFQEEWFLKGQFRSHPYPLRPAIRKDKFCISKVHWRSLRLPSFHYCLSTENKNSLPISLGMRRNKALRQSFTVFLIPWALSSSIYWHYSPISELKFYYTWNNRLCTSTITKIYSNL